MEIALISTNIIAITLAAYYFASAKAEHRHNQILQERLAGQSLELKEWQNKLLVKEGKGILGFETRKREQPPAPEHIVTTPRVMMRSQLEERTARDKYVKPETTPITTDVRQVQASPSFMEQAKEILRK